MSMINERLRAVNGQNISDEIIASVACLSSVNVRCFKKSIETANFCSVTTGRRRGGKNTFSCVRLDDHIS